MRIALSEGQTLAIKQLERIESHPESALCIDYIGELTQADDRLRIDISVDCSHYPRTEDGLALHDRESLSIWIPRDFPWKLPAIGTTHTRFYGFPHVQWGNTLCLYQSRESQWDPSRGMTGYIDQLNSWLKLAAINQLDADEGPLHPPIAYVSADTAVLIQADTPGPDEWPWVGTALYEEIKPGLISVNQWKNIADLEPGTTFIPVLLLDHKFSFEYPRYVKNLLLWIAGRGLPSKSILKYLMVSAERIEEGKPLRIVIGTPTRGIAGDASRRQQHLSVWEISPEDTEKLKMTSAANWVREKYKDTEIQAQVEELTEAYIKELEKWQEESKVGWCKVIEARPEIIIRRDKDSSMDWFKNKRVAIWGCGALGGHIAEHLVRAGVAAVSLFDNDKVDPGVLVRQNFVNEDTNEYKTDALKRRLLEINPSLSCEVHPDNLLFSTLGEETGNEDIDLVIDATASLSVRSKFEHWLKGKTRRHPIASMMLSGAARHGMLVLSPTEYSGGPFDVMRRQGLAAKNREGLHAWVDAFWQQDTSEPARQPEPGCSDATFVGSNADVAALAARMINALAERLKNESQSGYGLLLSQDATEKKDEDFHFPPDFVIRAADVEYRLSEHAWRDTRAWLKSGARERSAEDETGGLMFGQYDETLQIGWITAVSGPPSDSTFSAKGFVCGVAGTASICEEQQKRSLGAVQYVGTWHSHPVSEAMPSETDFAGVSSLFFTNPGQGAYQLMMIVGYASSADPTIGLYRFENRKISQMRHLPIINLGVDGNVIAAPRLSTYPHRIGLALSGGGSRAVAFHLGTLRALADTGLLDDVDILSGVSGGAVMTGLLGYTDAPFEEVEAKTLDFLSKGLAKPAFKNLLHPKRLLPALVSWLFVTLSSFAFSLLIKLINLLGSLSGIGDTLATFLKKLRWPLRRFYSRTHVMADTIAEVVKDGQCDLPTRNNIQVVFNACELRTGTAFRMSNTRYGSWRYGWAPASTLRIADAIAASAAYPVLLPAFDWKKNFSKNGEEQTARVLVTDGGVYENIGVSVMEPGRNADFNVIEYDPEVIIASDASAGQFTGEALPAYMSARLVQVMETVMRKVQDATKSRLHAHARDGHIERFVYAHLGQIDKNVPMRPSAWISRETVMHYPTDFSAMREENIAAISARGETITRNLMTRYLLSD